MARLNDLENLEPLDGEETGNGRHCDVEHNVSDTQNGMKVNKDIKEGKTVSFTFTKAGTYR